MSGLYRSTASQEKSLMRDMSECEAPYVHRIVIDSSTDKKNSFKDNDKSGILERPLVHELGVPTTSTPPPKSSEVVIKLRKAATFRHERPTINRSTFERPSWFAGYIMSIGFRCEEESSDCQATKYKCL